MRIQERSVLTLSELSASILSDLKNPISKYISCYSLDLSYVPKASRFSRLQKVLDREGKIFMSLLLTYETSALSLVRE